MAMLSERGLASIPPRMAKLNLAGYIKRIFSGAGSEMHHRNYRNSIARVFAGTLSEPVYNDTLEHVKIVVEEAFLAGDEKIRLLTNRFNPTCYGEPAIMRAAARFLSKDRSMLHILIEDSSELEACNPLLDRLTLAGGDRVKISILPRSAVANYAYNFLVVDKKGYRFEADRIDHIAVVAGGEKNLTRTRHLIEIFDALESTATPIPVAAYSSY
jgi:hypothetical protein